MAHSVEKGLFEAECYSLAFLTYFAKTKVNDLSSIHWKPAVAYSQICVPEALLLNLHKSTYFKKVFSFSFYGLDWNKNKMDYRQSDTEGSEI